MAGNIYAWSQTAATNANSDATINWAEGQLPGTVNDSARAEMAVHAGFLADNNATTTTGGTGAAYTVTSALTEASLATGIKLRLKMNVVNTGACTLTLTPAGGAAFAAKSIRTYLGGIEVDPPAGSLVANGIYEFNYDAAANGAAGAFILLNPTLQAGIAPGGRLTLTTATPVLNANTTAQGTVFYTPYTSNQVPIFGTFSEVSVVLDATNFLSGKNYDFFLVNNSGALALGYGPAWTNNTTRAGAISRYNGVWVNTATMTIRLSSSTTVSAAANTALYVGTCRATANAQTGMLFSQSAAGGGANILGVFNAYNRVFMSGLSADSTASWNYNTATWRAADGNTNNSISFVDGLGEVYTSATYSVETQLNNQGAAVGINLNSTSATPTITAVGATGATSGGLTAQLSVSGTFLPALGYNTITAMEAASAGNSAFFGSGGAAPGVQTQALSANLMV